MSTPENPPLESFAKDTAVVVELTTEVPNVAVVGAVKVESPSSWVKVTPPPPPDDAAISLGNRSSLNVPAEAFVLKTRPSTWPEVG